MAHCIGSSEQMQLAFSSLSGGSTSQGGEMFGDDLYEVLAPETPAKSLSAVLIEGLIKLTEK